MAHAGGSGNMDLSCLRRKCKDEMSGLRVSGSCATSEHPRSAGKQLRQHQMFKGSSPTHPGKSAACHLYK